MSLKMSYADFYIRYEHRFLRKIYSKEELETSKELKSLEFCYKVFDRFLTIGILLEFAITNWETFSETSKEKLSNFIEEHCRRAEDYHDIKHLNPQIPKFSQQLYAFVYGNLIEFPRSNTVTTANFLRNIYRIKSENSFGSFSHDR